MGYAVEADIRRHLGPVFSDAWPPSAGKPPTIADGVAFADNASGQIDGLLSARGVTTPVVVPASFVQHLRDMAAKYAAALVAAALVPSLANAAELDSRDHPEFLMRSWLDDITALQGPNAIPDTITMAGTSEPASFATSHRGTLSTDLDDTGVANDIEPVFRRDTKW